MLITDPSLSSQIMEHLTFRILVQHHVRLDTSWNYRVMSPFNRLYIVTAGMGRVRCGQAPVTLEKNNAYLLPLHTRFDLSCPYRLEKYYAHFRLELYGRDVFEQTGTWKETALPPALVRRITKLACSEKVNDAVTLRAILLDILGQWVKVTAQEVTAARRLAEQYAPLFNIINQQQCRAGLTMAQLAGTIHMTPGGLSKRFRREMGISVKRYYEQQLARRAQEELVFTTRRVNEIADTLRFSDEFYFSKFFKKMTGVSPREYRRQNKM